MLTFIKKIGLIIGIKNKKDIARYLTFILITISIISALATYSAITGSSSPFGPDPAMVTKLILTNFILFIILAITILRKVINMWLRRHKDREGSRIQTRIVLMFSLLTTIPTIIVAIFSALFFNYGIESWFNERVSTALENSVAVAKAYLDEHKENIKADILIMAHQLNNQSYRLRNDINLFSEEIEKQAIDKKFAEVLVFRADKEIIARSRLSFSLIFGLERMPYEFLERSVVGAVGRHYRNEVILLTNENAPWLKTGSESEDRVRALIKLDNFGDTYLLVGRLVDSKVLDYMKTTHGAVDEYKSLKSDISHLQVKFLIIFVIVALLLLLVAIAIGLIFASAIARPISGLAYASDRLKEGDFEVRVIEEGPKNDEIAILQRAFNRMAEQIATQQKDLKLANQQIDARRHFIETILGGVSAGVVAINLEKKITMVNKSAKLLLNRSLDQLVGHNLDQVWPEISELLNQTDKSSELQAEIKMSREDKKLILVARIVKENIEHDLRGYVVTFDDITPLVIAQRSAAWADVARRVGHEIKNPLTPIHLASERLKRKYSKEVSDPELFIKYTDTIIRHVVDIGKIVEEFVNFARMPAPIFSRTNICELVTNMVFSRKCLDRNIEYKLEIPQNAVYINCDTSQIDQVMINLLKNAEESIEARSDIEGLVIIKVVHQVDQVMISVEDNGKGFSEELFDRLTEPYVTSKAKGSGLGLAIVKKIIHDHNGIIEFKSAEAQGAIIKFVLPIGVKH